MKEDNPHPDSVHAQGAPDGDGLSSGDGGGQGQWSHGSHGSHGSQGPVEEAAEGEGRPSRRAAWIAMGAVMLALGLIWMAPGIGDESRITDPWTGFENTSAADAALIGTQAPLQFTVPDMHGNDVELASYRGKVILLNFWATWCPPCKVEIPDLVALQKEHPEDLIVLGLSIDDAPEELRPFAVEYEMNYPVLVGRERQAVQDAYGVWGLPVTVVIDREGRIADKFTGGRTKEQLERVLHPLFESQLSS